MKKLMMTTLLLATLTTANAQEKSTTGKGTKDPAVLEQRATERADKRTATMTEELGLTAEQTTKVDAINERHAKAVAQLRQAGLVEEARKERMKVLRNSRDNDLKQVLTAEQYDKMLALRKERKEAEGAEGADKLPHNE